MQQMTLSETRIDRALILYLSGEIDLGSAGQTGRILLLDAAAVLPPPDLIVVDLHAVPFIAVQGLRTLAEFAAAMQQRKIGCCYAAAAKHRLRHIVDVLGMTAALPIHATVEDALREGQH